MTIAIDIRSLQSNPGGITEYVYALISTLLSTQNEHYYVLFTSGSKQFVLPFPVSGPRHEVVNCRLPNKLLQALFFLLHLPKLDRYLQARTGRKIDICFMPNISFCAFSPTAKIVLTVHDISFFLYPWLFSLKMRLWHFVIGPRELLRRATHIIAVSYWTSHNLIREYGISKDTITVTPLAHSLSRPDGAHATQSERFTERCSFLLFAAHERRKNAHGVIAAFVRAYDEYPSSMHGMSLVLTGERKIIESVIRSVPGTQRLREHIICHGFVEKNERNALLASSRALLYPSMYEGFGIPLLEAARCRIPIIASARASIGEVIDSGALLIDPYNCEELAFAMHSILSDDHFCNDFVFNQEKQETLFKWDDTVTMTLKAFEYAYRN